MFKISLPRTLTLSASSLAILGLLALGSKSGSGSITVFNFGWNIQSAPLSVIAASYAMAVFPSLSKFFQLKDIKNYLLTISNTFKHIVFWVVPATILLIVLRAQIVRSILGFGEFSWRDTKLTAAILAIFSVSVLAQGLIVLLVRAFYAVGNTKIPLFVNVIFSGLSVYFAFVFKTLIIEIPLVSLFFIDLLRLNGVNNINVLALPMGFSLAVILNFSVLLLSFKLKFKNFHIETSRLIREHLGASLAGGLSAYGALYLFSDVFPNDKVWGVFTTGLLSGIIGIIIIGFILFLMKNRELMEFLTHFNKRIFKANPQGSDYIEN